MRIAYLHVLPIEYYPPAQNSAVLLADHKHWDLRVWTSHNRRGLPAWEHSGVTITRPVDANPESVIPLRMAGYATWHLLAARGISAWKPDALISVEPHSALAAWMYYKFFRGRAPLFIHHHEYYSPEDFLAPGMRSLRKTGNLERGELFGRAVWVSQTNAERLRLIREWNPAISNDAARVLPNYPPREWVERAASSQRPGSSNKIRMVYVGSASFEDTFIREAVMWVIRHPDRASLHVSGNNVRADVWNWIESLGGPNVSIDRSGCDHADLPSLLTQFDVGLVLYKGNTLNFVHNVTNKAIEYLACGLEVWYPPQMTGISRFHETFPAERFREVDFSDPSFPLPNVSPSPPIRTDFPFTAEAALAPLFAELDKLERHGPG